MKKIFLVIALCVGFGAITVSCKEKKEEKTEQHEADKGTHENSEEKMAMHDVYQCPMDCEKGKTYEEEGECPVCKMDLKKKKKEHENNKEHSEEHH